jgi:DNA-binding MarR family transcriptional regulator
MMTRAARNEAEDLGRAEMDLGLTGGFLGPRVRVLWNLLSSRMNEALAPFGLRPGAFSTLALISANPGASQTELARGLGLDKSALVPIIDELELRALAVRVRSPHDRRRHALMLTKAGEALMRQMYVDVERVGRPIREGLTEQEYDQMLSLIDRAYAALAQADPQAGAGGEAR